MSRGNVEEEKRENEEGGGRVSPGGAQHAGWRLDCEGEEGKEEVDQETEAEREEETKGEKQGKRRRQVSNHQV